KFGPVTTKNFELVTNFDRRLLPEMIARRETFYRALRRFLGPRDLLCVPTSPSPAPVKGGLGLDQRTGNYYRSALSLTSIAGLARLPQVSMPLVSVPVDGGTAPVGLSLLGSFGEDVFLLDTVKSVAAASGDLPK